jgi:hypothetical protein
MKTTFVARRGKCKGEQMSFIQFIMALFGIGSNAGAQIDPHG